ncbi:MAG: response regulator transcription factor, partial [Actinobacteria bacterium]|nr:response regulator transcription factor [Actinomycetota bacterium]
MQRAPITIVVAEDNAIFARGLAELLNVMPEVTLCEVATDRDTALVAIQRHSPDVVITDLRMPPTGTDEGLQVARRARSISRKTGIIVFSQFAEPAVAAALLDVDGGAVGYLLKDRVGEPTDLLEAIIRVQAGGIVLDPALVDALVAHQYPADDPLAPLTAAERDVLRLMAQGYGNDGIADRLRVGRSAVE